MVEMSVASSVSNSSLLTQGQVLKSALHVRTTSTIEPHSVKHIRTQSFNPHSAINIRNPSRIDSKSVVDPVHIEGQSVLHVINPSQLYTMEPLYAQVQKKPRNTPEDRQQNSLEAFYGGKELSNSAAFIIQRAFRAFRLRKKFSTLLSVALKEQEIDRNEINVDTGLHTATSNRILVKPCQPSPVPTDIDLLILQAAGLETFSSIVTKKQKKNNLRRTQSFKVPRKRSMENLDPESSPGPVPRPCPALKGSYGIPKPPQRTVSFLAKPKLPNKISQNINEKRPLPSIPPQDHSQALTANSAEGIYIQPRQFHENLVHHLRSHSSPAPLSPPQRLEIPRDDEPLPPPPYISPPLPEERAPPTPSPPPPPPPELYVDEKPLIGQGQRQPCDSSSSASSIDSGFRSSYLESPTNWNVASPNLIVSPESLNVMRDVVFEPNAGVSKDPSVSSLPSPPQQPLYGQIQRPPQRNYSILKKKSVKFQQTQNPSEIDEAQLRRQYKAGLNLFNQSPEFGMEYLMKKNFVDYSPSSVGKFLKGRKGLSKAMIGQYLCQLQRPFNLASLHCFIHEMDFSGLHLDIALRHLYQEITPPASEAQKVEKVIEVFAKRYIACNQLFANQFKSPDAIFVLSYAIVLLNTDLHSKAVKMKRMKREDFVRNLKGADQGSDLDPEMLQGIYDRIKDNELKAGSDHVSQLARLEETIIYKKGQNVAKQPLASDTSRRLVCFCRLTEVPDVHKKAKIKADAHQRGIFLFNDLLVVTKTLTKKEKMKHQFRFHLELRNLRINVFSTNQYPYGVQLQDKLTGKISATFNARSETDQQKFVYDLEDSIAEMAEMERAKCIMNEDNLRNEILEDDAYETLC